MSFDPVSLLPPNVQSSESTLARQRVRALLPNLHLGFHPPGKLNAITDVPGVAIGMVEVHEDGDGNGSGKRNAVNTGVTAILPRPHPEWFHTACYASIFSFNGSGELTGSHWLSETGLLNSPILLTNSFSIGPCYSGIYEFTVREHLRSQARELKDKAELGKGAKDGKSLVDFFLLPVVGETYDGFLNDIGRLSVKSEHAVRALELAVAAGEDAVPQQVREGSTGGGTGMLTMGFKGGTGTSSRIVPGILHGEKTEWTVGCLVQSNFGKLEDLHFGSVPVGREWKREFAGTKFENGCIFAGPVDDDGKDAEKESPQEDSKPEPLPADPREGSIIALLATNAPLNPTQLQRLAKRATVGLSKVGGFGANSSGDIFLAFSTAPGPPREPATNPDMSTWEARRTARVEKYSTAQGDEVGVERGDFGGFVQDTTISGLFEAAAECVSEAVLNAMCMAEGMVGVEGNGAAGLPLAWVKQLIQEKYDDGE